MSKIEFLKFFTLIVCAFCICESIILSYIVILNINIDNCDGKYIKKLHIKSLIFLIVGILSYLLYNHIK